MTTATVGWSTHRDAAHCGREAAERAVARLSSQKPQLAIVFGSSWFDQPALLRGVRSILKGVPLVGESTSGEIVPTGPTSHSCVVMTIASKTLQWSIGAGEDVDTAPREAGQQAAYAALRRFPSSQRIGCLLFGDGLVTTYAEVMRGAQEVLGTGSLVVGGLAGDDLRFTQTYQYINDRVLSRAIVGAIVGGQGKMGVGIEHGFSPISKPRHITRAHGNILVELDHQPAASVYEEYFGHELVGQMRLEGFTRQRIAYPLGIQCEGTDRRLLRNVVAFQDDGSLACSGEIPEDSWLQLMIGSQALALDAARSAAQQAIQSLNRVVCVLVFDSVARRKLLGERHAAMEIAQVRHLIGPDVPLAGCYTYGEQAPVGVASLFGRTVVHTSSILVIAIGT